MCVLVLAAHHSNKHITQVEDRHGQVKVKSEMRCINRRLLSSLLFSSDILRESPLHPIHPPGGERYDPAHNNNQPVRLQLCLLQN